MEETITIATLKEDYNGKDYHDSYWLEFNPRTGCFEVWENIPLDHCEPELSKIIEGAKEVKRLLKNWASNEYMGWEYQLDKEELQRCLDYDYEKVRRQARAFLKKTASHEKIIKCAIILGVQL